MNGDAVLTVPELGPAMGHLTDPPGDPSGLPRAAALVPLDRLRLELVTRLFELAGAARAHAARGEGGAAVRAISRATWSARWDDTVTAAAHGLTEQANLRLQAAAAESRLPQRRLRRVLVDEAESRAIAGRLAAASAELGPALDAIDRAAPAALRDAAGEHAWQAALLAAAARTETSWRCLAELVQEEEAFWLGEAARVRAWRRPRWPILAATTALLLLAGWLGLVLGGYLPAPAPLQGLTAWWWARL